MHTSVLIIGSGPAGYTAGIYATRAGLQTVLMTGAAVGGQLMLTHEVENYPGFINISGFDLMEALQNQAKETGVEFKFEQVTRLDLSQKPFSFETEMNRTGTADTVILATGALANWLKVPGEEKFKGRGISVCATCDGFFYKNKTVAVVGGGNTALYESLYLTQVATQVYLIHRHDFFTAEKNLQEKVKNNPKIKIFYDSEVKEFQGEKQLTSILVKNNRTDDSFSLQVNGVFEAIGTKPNTELVRGQLKLNELGYIITDKRTMETSIPGVFACGDVQEDKYRQAIIAAGSGCIAALSAEKYLLNTTE